MTDAEIDAFLVAGHTLQVATVGRDGFPHLAPMFYVVDGGRVVFRSFTKSQKIVNLERNPKLTVLVETGREYAELKGVMIKGHASLISDREYVLQIYGQIAARYVVTGSEPVELDPAALEAAFGRYADKNTAVVVEPEHVISWDHTKLGGVY